MAELWESDIILSTLENELSRGEFLGPACERAGLTRQAVWTWGKRVKAGSAPPELVNAHARIEAARQRGVAVHAARLAASEDWRAAAWTLERLDREQFGEVTRTELTGAEGGPVEVAQVASQVRERLRRLADAAEAPALPEGPVKR